MKLWQLCCCCVKEQSWGNRKGTHRIQEGVLEAQLVHVLAAEDVGCQNRVRDAHHLHEHCSVPSRLTCQEVCANLLAVCLREMPDVDTSNTPPYLVMPPL